MEIKFKIKKMSTHMCKCVIKLKISIPTIFFFLRKKELALEMNIWCKCLIEKTKMIQWQLKIRRRRRRSVVRQWQLLK